MLKMRTQIAGFAMVAAMFVGCSTTSKQASTSVDELLHEDTEVDVGRFTATEDGGRIGRSPAEIGPIAKLIEHLRGTTNGDTKAAKYLKTLNERFGKMKEFTDHSTGGLGKKHDPMYGSKMDEAGLAGLSNDLQKQIVRDFLNNADAYLGLGTLETEVKEAKVAAEEALGSIRNGGIDGAKLSPKDPYRNVHDGGRLSVDWKGREGSPRGVRTDGGAISARNATEHNANNSLKQIYNQMVDPNTAEFTAFKGPDGNRLAVKMVTDEKEFRTMTKRSALNAEMCKDFDEATAKSYNKLQEELIADVKNNADSYEEVVNGKTIKRYKSCAELEAWAMARFQVGLGRQGIAAWTAVEEMGVCKTARTDHAEAARKYASENEGKIPEKAPKCK